MAPKYEISEGELSDRLKTIDEITNRDILRAEGSFNKQILQSRCIRKDHQNIYVLIQELEVRLLQDALRGISPIPEKEMLQDYQEYLDYLNAEIAVQLERTNYKYILMPKPAYREVRDMLYTFSRLGMVKLCTEMRWRELARFLTPAHVSFDRDPSGIFHRDPHDAAGLR